MKLVHVAISSPAAFTLASFYFDPIHLIIPGIEGIECMRTHTART